jgi:zinc transporter ZupT
MAAGAGVVLLPAVTYVITYILTFNHALAAGAMVVVASAELLAIAEFVRQS